MKNIWFKKIISSVTLLVFISTGAGPSYARAVVHALDLPAAGAMVQVSRPFAPPLLKGIDIDPRHPFKFDFILDTGNSSLADEDFKDVSNKLIRYFLASLTIPEKELWVNLSPYEKDRIIPDEFSMTEMGRDLLAEDYMLKQITASLIYPENETGRTFWNKVYAAASEKYGTTDVPVDTFNKVWIVPGKAVVYEKGTKVFITEATLEVMLETDYLAQTKGTSDAVTSMGQVKMDAGMGKEIIREIVIPILEKEVNEGANFAQLRQVYYALILAKWYKEALQTSVINRKYSDQKKTSGVDLAGKGDKQFIYEQYLEAFKKGAFNYVKEEYDANTQELIPRKYFSGGCNLVIPALEKNSNSRALQQGVVTGTLKKIVSFFKGAPGRSAAWMGKSELRRLAMTAAVTAVLALGAVSSGQAQGSLKLNVQGPYEIRNDSLESGLDKKMVKLLDRYKPIVGEFLGMVLATEGATPYQAEQLAVLRNKIRDEVKANGLMEQFKRDLSEESLLKLVQHILVSLKPYSLGAEETNFMKNAFSASRDTVAVSGLDCDALAFIIKDAVDEEAAGGAFEKSPVRLVDFEGHTRLQLFDGNYFELTDGGSIVNELDADEELQANPIRNMQQLKGHLFDNLATQFGLEADTGSLITGSGTDEDKKAASEAWSLRSLSEDPYNVTSAQNYLTKTSWTRDLNTVKRRLEVRRDLITKFVQSYLSKHPNLEMPRNNEVRNLSQDDNLLEVLKNSPYILETVLEQVREMENIRDDPELAKGFNVPVIAAEIAQKYHMLSLAREKDLVSVYFTKKKFESYLLAGQYKELLSEFDETFSKTEHLVQELVRANNEEALASLAELNNDRNYMLSMKLVTQLRTGQIKVAPETAEKFYDDHKDDRVLASLMDPGAGNPGFFYMAAVETMRTWDGISQFQDAFKDPRLRARMAQERAVKEAEAKRILAEKKAAKVKAEGDLLQAVDTALVNFNAGPSGDLEEMKVLRDKLYTALDAFGSEVFNNGGNVYSRIVRWARQERVAKLGVVQYDGESFDDYIVKVVNTLFKEKTGQEFKKDFSEETGLKGGIDLNTARINIEGQGQGAAVEWDYAQFENIEINGLEPVIMNILPLENLPQFMS